MGFWGSFFGTCCGPQIFKDLRNHSWMRVIWHLFLICFFCSVAVGIGNYVLIKYRWRAIYNNFNEIFGPELILAKNGILPQNSPDVNRFQELPNNSLLFYAGNDQTANVSDEMLRQRNLIFFWGRGALAVFVRSDKVWQQVAKFSPEEPFIQQSADLLTYDQMKSELLTLAKLPISENWSYPEEYRNGLTSYQVLIFARMSYALGKAFFYFLTSLSLTVFSSLFFVLLFRLFSFGRPKIFSFSELYKVALYAAFPVLIVVNAFPALQLPGARFFEYLFLFGWIGYLSFVLKYLVRLFCEDQSKNWSESNGED